jgi:glutamate synthase (NADPH/NADH) small chain
MPAREEEIEHAHEEGIIFRTLCAPIAVHEDEDGFCAKVTLQNMELGDLDASGRPRPVPIEGVTVEVDCDVLIIAVGTKANATLDLIVPSAEKTKRGYLACDETGKSSVEGVFGGGDITTGAATVIEAMGAGRKAAFEITRWLAS